MKVAIVYDRVNKWGGAERVLLALHELFPDAPLYTSVYSPEHAPWARVFPKIYTSFLQKLPYARTHHEQFAWMMPIAFESFNFDGYDVVICVTSEAAKGIITSPGQKHICYCLTPTRYLWSGYGNYFPSSLKREVISPVIKYLQKWDKVASSRPDKIVSISTEVRDRVQKYYNRDSTIIFPPVSLPVVKNYPPKDYFLLVSRLVPYKKVDLAIRAFNHMNWPLIIVGSGSEEARLHEIAQSNIKFLGNVTDQELSTLYGEARALIFPQEEDFGLVAVEANLHATPVIAYKAGGALDTVIHQKNGILFKHQTVEDLITAVKIFNKTKFSDSIISRSARRFSKTRFKEEFKKLVNDERSKY